MAPPTVSGPAAPVAPPPAAGAGRVGFRIAALFVLLLITELWVKHLFGVSLTQLPLVAPLTAAATGVGWMVGKKYFEARVDTIRERIRPLLGVPLCGLAVVLTLAMAVVSSVTVIAQTGGAGEAVSVAPAGRPDAARTKRLETGKGPVHVPVLSHPFGRSYTIDVAGYVPATLAVYPMVGLRLRLGDDLDPVRSVLFRPGIHGLLMLEGGAVFRISRVTDGGVEAIAVDSGSTSFLLGPPQRIPADLIPQWQLELRAMDLTEQGVAHALTRWREPRSVRPDLVLTPGTRLVAEIMIGHDIIEHAAITLGADRLVHVRLRQP